ncbi:MULTISPECIES: DUF1501 domain-containing protein [Gimesia]|jgi:hypothetical protein|uniref:Uncharacterized protein n=2 Tax=Gimesia TaxID=1649453 RepID=A0A517WGK6_9PLAN|nr:MULTISPECIES: DUF1501 domain-containing protein [Gimesia]KAA0133677.1 DUF1501 domain-containing protein [Gimesia chilikensis]QDT22368.1 hypothetical protein HG66A1_41750 [Gimesia chilikensis]QDT86302.1 hypothetical protein MalM14_39760 [Gimesia chilikensis]QDU04386.1 hypothetical protein V6x_41130 [Gimesia chilikensis]QGQ25869.1 DUF1501 domain-containing protein [Gimesia benthica]
MKFNLHSRTHSQHAFTAFNPLVPEGLVVQSRRNMLKASLAGLAGLTVPNLLRASDSLLSEGKSSLPKKSIILLWMTGGPSHIDTWDPKPDRPIQNRGPFGVTQTNVPGITITDRLPKQAAMMDRFTLIRSVDPKMSSHQPNQVMQTANLLATPRTNRKGDKYPAMASIVAKHHGSNHPGMPPYVAFMKHDSHIAWGGYLGKQYDPFIANDAADLPVYDMVGKDTGGMSGGKMFQFAPGLSFERMKSRRDLMLQFDNLRSDIDQAGSMNAIDSYSQRAYNMVLGKRVQQAFDLSQESAETRDRYGKHLWCQQALLARRLVEAGSSFVTLDLSYHTASGTWDNHGDNIPPYGGIKNGLGPLLPLFDHLLTTLVLDLEERGRLDDTLVIAMGEFGRSPMSGTQGSTDGRNHWPVVMSMCMAGGGLNHGQVIGASENDGSNIKHRPVRPGDLAATIYRYMGVPLDTHYVDDKGRPIPVIENGAPIHELF